MDLPAQFLPLVALYPEIHYRFRFLPFSRYFRRQPEIIADAPWRLEPGQALPLLLLIKDAHRFPIALESVDLEARCPARTISRRLELNETIAQPWWHLREWLNLPEVTPTTWEIDVTWNMRIGKRKYRLRNDNLPGLSHAPLSVVQSGYPWPRQEGWLFGDLHAHTAYTEDQVEFGAPLSVYPDMGLAQGLSFAFAADHSYDLDDLPGSWSRSDPFLQRFQQRSAEISRLNEQYQGRFALLPGFELSAANARGKNVHLLLVGEQNFLAGSGDSAERWLFTKSELTLHEAISALGAATLPIAAHPLVQPPRLERLLLGRGCWENADVEAVDLFALQIWNGETSEDFFAGINRWVKGLLAGRRWKIVAGSDAHGNFNRYRQVGFPMLRLAETDRHVFGKMRTGVFLPQGLDRERLIAGLKSSRSLITDGPFADLRTMNTSPEGLSLCAEARSSPEFGALDEVTIYWGKTGETDERILRREKIKGDYEWEARLPIPAQEGYLRLEITTAGDHRCLTNPIYLSDPPP